MTVHEYKVVAHLIWLCTVSLEAKLLLVDTGFEISTVPDADI